MEEILYFVLVILKRMSPSEASNPLISIPTAAAGTSAQPLVAKPPVAQPAPTPVAPQPAEPDVATEPSEVELEPPIATPFKGKTLSKKKSKKNK